MKELINYIPILTSILAIYFSILLIKHYRVKPSKYVLWWMIGVMAYGVGTITESVNILFGWSELNFRFWYISGALLGGAPLAQGTVYLLLKQRTANFLSVLLSIVIIVAAVSVTLSPVDASAVVNNTLTGKIFDWQWVRLFSPFINIYAFIFLFGGAVYSAWKYYKGDKTDKRFLGNVYIAMGALLPGIGGSFTRFGHVEVLFVTELVGLSLIYMGYQVMKGDKAVSIHKTQRAS